jgi:hypothetical protein
VGMICHRGLTHARSAGSSRPNGVRTKLTMQLTCSCWRQGFMCRYLENQKWPASSCDLDSCLISLRTKFTPATVLYLWARGKKF